MDGASGGDTMWQSRDRVVTSTYWVNVDALA